MACLSQWLQNSNYEWVCEVENFGGENMWCKKKKINWKQDFEEKAERKKAYMYISCIKMN